MESAPFDTPEKFLVHGLLITPSPTDDNAFMLHVPRSKYATIVARSSVNTSIAPNRLLSDGLVFGYYQSDLITLKAHTVGIGFIGARPA